MPFDQAANNSVVSQEALAQQAKAQAPQGATPTTFQWQVLNLSATPKVIAVHNAPSEEAVAEEWIQQAPWGATPGTAPVQPRAGDPLYDGATPSALRY